MSRSRKPIKSVQQKQKVPQHDPSIIEFIFQSALDSHQKGRLDEAIAGYRHILSIYPSHADALHLLGLIYQLKGNSREAEVLIRQALKIREDPIFFSNLGNLLAADNQLSEAEEVFRRAIKLNPDYANAFYNLGNLLKNSMQPMEAMACYRRVLELRPTDLAACVNLGNVLRDLGRLDEAETSYRNALQINPNIAEVHDNLGSLLMELDRLDEAVTSYCRALEIKPDYALAHNNLGVARLYLGQVNESIESCRRAIAINPDFPRAHSNLLAGHNYLSGYSPEKLVDAARSFNEIVARYAVPYENWSNLPDPERRLRVGLVSGRFCNGPVGYFLEAMLAAQAANKSGLLEFFAYSTHFRTDAKTERLKSYFQSWFSTVNISDESLAKKIHGDGIDILIDLSGHSPHNRLPMFSWKPAPVQATWLDYFATTGVEAIDYLIADPWSVPEVEEAHFTEKVWRLPETRLCFTPPDTEVTVSKLPALENGYITFGCFNNLTKMNNHVVALWARLLTLVPNSRLFLKAGQLKEQSVQQQVIKRFATHGVNAAQLILEGPDPREIYLAAYQRVDISLDPFPFTGATTSAETLWMGVPVLTLAGDRFVSRQGVSLLMNAGLSDWIASDAEDYIARAITKAGDPQSLATLRNQLRQQVLISPIFDAPRFARHFEAALRGMWIQWCNRQMNS